MKFDIIGTNMQTLKISLAKGEKIYADSGKLVSKDMGVVMTPRMVGGVMGVIERKFTGATGLLTEFTPKDDKGGAFSVAGVFPGKVKQIELGEGEEFVAQDHAFLAAEDTVKFTIQTVGIGAAFFGGAGLVLQKFVGPGNVFIHVDGDIIEYTLDGTSEFEIDPGHIAGFDASLQYKIRFVDNIRTAMFGGVGLFLATFSGKGKIITHSVSRFKLASEIYLEGLQQNPKAKK